MLQHFVNPRCRLVPLIIHTCHSDSASVKQFLFPHYWVKNSPSSSCLVKQKMLMFVSVAMHLRRKNRGSVQGNLSVDNPSFSGGVRTYITFLYNHCRLVSAENKELKFMACLTAVVPCSSFDYSSCSTPSALHTAEDVTYQRISPWSCYKFNVIH